jgi:PKD repeat protein
VQVTIHDDNGGMAIETFVVTVTNVDPMLTGTDGHVVNEGDSVTLTGLGVGLADPGFDNPLNTHDPANGGELTETFEVTKINWGDGSIDDNTDADLTDLVSIVNRVSGGVGTATTAEFSHAAHTYADNGTYTVTITIKDDDGNFVDRSFTILVENVQPTLTPIGNQTVDESQDLVLPVVGTFTDPGFDKPANPGGATSESFRYFLDWGDGRDQIGSLAVADLNGSPGTPSSGMFGGAHNYADNGVYTVTLRIADDDMTGDFAGGSEENGDFVQQTFTVTVNNLGPAFVPQPDGANLQADDVSSEGITTIRVAYNDPGYDNLLNTLASNGGETVETFNHVVQWGDGTVDAIHQYTTSGTFTVTVTMTPSGGGSQQFTFGSFNSASPVLTLVSSQQLNDPAVVPQVVTYVVNWGDGHVETFQLSGLLNPGVPVASNGLTSLVASARNSGNATTLTTGSAQVQHRYLGPPNPLHPTADIVITLTVYDDDGASVADTVAISNPGIQTSGVAIDTTPDVPRLDLTQRPMTEVYVADQGGLTQLLQVPDVRGGGGEVAASDERYLEVREVSPDGTEGQGYRIKDEALLDLRSFFATLYDGRYSIYRVRTENHSERLVIQVDVRRGRVIDVSDDSEGTRDRPPVDEGQSPAAVPLDENPLLEAVPGEARQGDLETRKPGETAENTHSDDQRVSLSPPLLISLTAAARAAQPWSRRVDSALAEADETAWKRLRRAGRRSPRTTQLLNPPRMRPLAGIDYNNT